MSSPEPKAATDPVISSLRVLPSDRELAREPSHVSAVVVNELAGARVAGDPVRQEPMTATPRARDRDEPSPRAVVESLRLRAYVPRSGSGSVRPHDPTALPRAPIGVPVAASVSLAELTPKQLAERQDRIRLENSRTRKWLDMLAKPLDTPAARKSLKKRCRKGIPDGIRGTAWFRLVNGGAMRAAAAAAGDPTYAELLELQLPRELLEENGGSGSSGRNIASSSSAGTDASGQGVLNAAAASPLAMSAATASVIGTIERDINRTFPTQSLFSEVGGVGQIGLFRVLVAYAYVDPAVGYCQGMGFLAAMLLCYLPEEDAFWAFNALLRGPHLPRHQVRGMFAAGLPKLAVVAHVLQVVQAEVHTYLLLASSTHFALFAAYPLPGLVNRRLPRIAAFFSEHGLHPNMYSAQWFMTIFTYNLPFDASVRVWDAFLCEGWKAVYRAALGLLTILQPRLLACAAFEQIMLVFRDTGTPGVIAPDALAAAAGRYKLKWSQVTALEAECEALQAAGLPTADARAGSWPAAAAGLQAAIALAQTQVAGQRQPGAGPGGKRK